jgi:hypothetical protein
MDRSQLLALAKERGFTRYSKLNKGELIRLLKNGSHSPPPARHWYSIIANGEGVSIDKLFTPYDHMHKYAVAHEQVPEGYIIRGVNLNGMFESQYIADRTIQREEIDYGDNTDDEDVEPVTVVRSVQISGGWLIPLREFPKLQTLITSLRSASQIKQPRTLFEAAARVVNSKKQTRYLPKIIKSRLKQYK